MTITFVLGSVIVLIATWLYNQPLARANILISKETWSWMKPEKSKEDISLRTSSSSTPQFGGLAVTLSLASSGGTLITVSDPESRPFIR
jgi:hypothetical protein